MNRILKTSLLRLAIVAVGMIVPLEQATALEILVTGNGASSQQAVVVAAEKDANVSQQNDTTADTEVLSSHNTGSNTISDTTGSVSSITTGDISEVVAISTEANSNSAVVNQCCAQDTVVKVTNNGAGSTNDVDMAISRTLGVSTHQQAIIRQSHVSNGETGNNHIDDTTGAESTIETGSIVTDHDLSVDVNRSVVSAQVPGEGITTIKIAGNGTDSVTLVSYTSNKVFDILVQHSEELVNSIIADYSTGNNFINGLTGGSALIITGDISSEASSSTTGSTSAVSLTDVSCSTDDPGDGPGDVYVTPPNTTVTSPAVSSTGSSGSDSTASNAVGGAILGMTESLLPSTGADSLYAFLIANILMLVFGCYLRLRSGRAPAIRVVLA